MTQEGVSRAWTHFHMKQNTVCKAAAELGICRWTAPRVVQTARTGMIIHHVAQTGVWDGQYKGYARVLKQMNGSNSLLSVSWGEC